MTTAKREIVVKAFSKDTCGIQSQDEIWYNAIDEIKKSMESQLSQLNKGDTIEMTADFQQRRYTQIVIKKKAEKKSGNGWQDDMTKFKDLLNDAHNKFPKLSIETEKIEIDLKQKYALFKATIYVENKVQIGGVSNSGQSFQAHGDSTADNIDSDKVKVHFIRMAETRSIVRALRLLTNNAKVAVEETEKGEDPLEKK